MMIGFAVAVLFVIGLVWLALVRMKPQAAVLNPWPYVLRCSPAERFERNLPEPGQPICGAVPPVEVLRDLAARGDSITACYMEPHGRRDGIAHTGIIPKRSNSRSAFSFTWVDRPPILRSPTWRLAWWRRALIRLASA
jgi:hypothetical protein